MDADTVLLLNQGLAYLADRCAGVCRTPTEEGPCPCVRRYMELDQATGCQPRLTMAVAEAAEAVARLEARLADAKW